MAVTQKAHETVAAMPVVDIGDPQYVPVNPKGKTGRKSEFTYDYCDSVVQHCSGGCSVVSFANLIGVKRGTVYEWANQYPLFGDALNRARDASYSWWEHRARLAAITGCTTGQANIILRALTSLNDEWRDMPKRPDPNDDAANAGATLFALLTEARRLKATKAIDVQCVERPADAGATVDDALALLGFDVGQQSSSGAG